MSPETPCDKEVYEHGTVVLITHGPSREIESWVIKVREDSGQRVDWHYVGGRAVIACIGDVEKVRDSIAKFAPDLADVHRRSYSGSKLKPGIRWCIATGYNGVGNVFLQD